jgi:hypothetical protein
LQHKDFSSCNVALIVTVRKDRSQALRKISGFQCAVTETEGNTQKEKQGDQRGEAEGKCLGEENSVGRHGEERHWDRGEMGQSGVRDKGGEGRVTKMERQRG